MRQHLPVLRARPAKLGSVRVAGCADIDQARAEAMAKAHDLNAYASPDELMDDPSVGLVVNITPPAAHGTVTSQALARGKHVFVEKPLAASLADAEPVMAVLAGSAARRTRSWPRRARPPGPRSTRA